MLSGEKSTLQAPMASKGPENPQTGNGWVVPGLGARNQPLRPYGVVLGRVGNNLEGDGGGGCTTQSLHKATEVFISARLILLTDRTKSEVVRTQSHLPFGSLVNPAGSLTDKSKDPLTWVCGDIWAETRVLMAFSAGLWKAEERGRQDTEKERIALKVHLAFL